MVKILYKSSKKTPLTRFGHEMVTILVEEYLFKKNGSVNDDQNQTYFYCGNERKKSSSTSQKCHASVRLRRDTYKAEHGLVEIITEHCDQCLPKQNVQKEVKNDPSLNPMIMELSILCEEKWIRPTDLYQRLVLKNCQISFLPCISGLNTVLSYLSCTRNSVCVKLHQKYS